MPKDQLTDADMAEHRITFRRPEILAKTVCAAYVTTEDKHPDMLAFKDSEHRTVYMVSRSETLDVERLERSEVLDELKKKITEGFLPTSRVMEGM